MVMGEAPQQAVAKTLTRLQRIRQGIAQFRPCYTMSLRIVLAFGIASLDPIADAMPLDATTLQPVQRAVTACLTFALRLPRTAPHDLLYTPITAGGFGVPHLSTRFQLRFLRTFLKALNCRNYLVRETTRHVLAHPESLGCPPHDVIWGHPSLSNFFSTWVFSCRLHLQQCLPKAACKS